MSLVARGRRGGAAARAVASCGEVHQIWPASPGQGTGGMEGFAKVAVRHHANRTGVRCNASQVQLLQQRHNKRERRRRNAVKWTKHAKGDYGENQERGKKATRESCKCGCDGGESCEGGGRRQHGRAEVRCGRADEKAIQQVATTTTLQHLRCEGGRYCRASCGWRPADHGKSQKFQSTR